MLRVLGQVLQREVVVIAVTEMVFGAIGIYVAFWSTAPSAYQDMSIADQIFIVLTLIFCFGMAASVLGLYRPSTITDAHNLLTKLLLIGVFGFFVAAILYWAIKAGVGVGIASITKDGTALREVEYAAHTRSGLVDGLLRDGIGLGRIEPVGSADLALAVITVSLAWFACLAATQVLFAAAIRHDVFCRRIVVIVPPNDAERFQRFIADGRYRQFEKIRLIQAPHEAAGDGIASRLIPEMLRQRVWAIVAAGNTQALPASVLLELRLRGVRVFSEAAFWEHEGCWIDVDGGDVSWVLDHGGFRYGPVSEAVKRVLDVTVAAALIALTSPITLLVAVLIRLESSGPVLYRQERVGLHGRPFVLYKFRSMRQDAEAAGIPQWATVRDPRVTRIGRVIRDARIDDLPQLINVLRGEMSLVGPRPERPYFVNQLVARVPFYAQRHCVKPGITGWAQINAPYGASLDDARAKLRYDLYYAKNRSFVLDLWILLCTVQVVLFRQGAR